MYRALSVARYTVLHLSRDLDTQGLKAIIESIDNRADFKTYMQHYAFAHNGLNSKGPKREGPREDGYVGLSTYIKFTYDSTILKHLSPWISYRRSLQWRQHIIPQVHRTRPTHTERTKAGRRSVWTWRSR